MSAALVALPPQFEPILPQLRADLAARLDAPDVRLTPLAYEDRPFSHLLRLRAESIEHGTQRMLFAKIYKSKPDLESVSRMRERVAMDFESTRRIAETMARHQDLGVVRPVACYLEQLTIVTEQAPGQTLREYLDVNARWFPSSATQRQLEETLSNVGRWLRAFQAVDPVTGPVDVGDLRSYVDLRLKRLVQQEVYTETRRQAVLEHLSRLGEEVPAGDLREVLIHADLAPGNVLVSPGRVIVIDLAMVQRGSALHDISRLHLQLDVLRAKPQFRSAVIDGLQRALLRGFDATLSAEHPLFRFLLMLHRINHFSTLSFGREPFPRSLLSRRVLRVHRDWIEDELERTPAPVRAG